MSESPCVHMHEATWHNSPAASVMDTTPSGDEYIRRGKEPATVYPLFHSFFRSLSLSLYQPSVSLSAFIVGFRVTFPNEALCQNGTGTSTNTSKFKMRHHEGQTSIADWCHIKHSL